MERSQTSREEKLKIWFDSLFEEFNRSQFLLNDPVGIVHEFNDPQDQEFVALVAALFAYGNVKCIRQAIRNITTPLCTTSRRPRPSVVLTNMSDSDIEMLSNGIYYRFYSSRDIQLFLIAIRNLLVRFGSLESAYSSAKRSSTIEGLTKFRELIINELPHRRLTQGLKFMFADPQSGTAKRWHLFLRWMVRKDEIDLGLWSTLDRSELIQPLDTHIFHIARELKLIKRASASLKSALEITTIFKQWAPEDPIRYDFALCQLGIQKLRKERVREFLIGQK